ncbi:DUF397 domain-containing protein [Kitasatospora sp. NPDC058046]|uniref:DUF397 domain-containing protein n=1 Tax=Kitasatospora sp. NPDC058046 TaxID=3346312 RepID=UPI0036DA0EA3
MHSEELPAHWRTSSYTNGNGGDCVEVDDNRPGTVRDTKDRQGPWLHFTPEAWASFVAGVQAGDFGTV